MGREGEREGEKNQCVVASRMPHTGDPALNWGLCPDWESSQQPSGSQAGTQSTEPHQPGWQQQFLNVPCIFFVVVKNIQIFSTIS